MRLWFSPDLERIEVDEGISHSMTIIGDPERYGLDPSAVADYMDTVNDGDADFQFDFDAVITLAEMAGWVRVSGFDEAPGGQIGISASDVRPARKVLGSLQAEGHEFMGGVGLEIERLTGGAIISEHRFLDAAAVGLFIGSGRLPMAQRGSLSLEPETVEFVRAVLSARRNPSPTFQHA